MQVFRQRNQEFVELLNSIRLGTCTEAMAETLQRTSNNRLNSGGLEAIKLFPTNAQASIEAIKLVPINAQMDQDAGIRQPPRGMRDLKFDDLLRL
ncbi:hypothetical protein T484DRAFT_1759560 [Baffinella frigidus]|nr:hypothetical protein T484DRAFT_1759560 [Cryptophyta sp. CCMP2293]